MAATTEKSIKRHYADSLPESVKDVYKNYSHGFEAIYALETIDPNSIRIFTGNTSSQKDKEVIERPDVQEEAEWELDMGPSLRKWIPPFFPDEPIQVLGLSLLAEKTLLANGKKTVADLLDIDLHELAHLKGIGQGHLDEIDRCLKLHRRSRHCTRAYQIDFSGWIKKLLGAADRKKVKVALEKYRLDHIVELTPSESMEIKRLTLETRREWIEEMTNELSHAETVQSVNQDFSFIIEAFVKHWMGSRGGFASQEELTERLERVSENREDAQGALQLFQSLYPSPFEKYLVPIENGLYAAHDYQAHRYRSVIEKAMTYFYRADICYALDELTGYLLRDFCKEWKDISEAYMARVLSFSARFRVRKGEQGKKIVRFTKTS